MTGTHESRNFFLHGPAGRLEAILWTPSAAAHSPLAAVVCHPHPLFGGTMHNKVVYQTAKSLDAVGIPVLRFNFRGAGLSAGVHDRGFDPPGRWAPVRQYHGGQRQLLRSADGVRSRHARRPSPGVTPSQHRRDARRVQSPPIKIGLGGVHMPLFPGNRLYQMIVDAAVLSFAAWLLVMALGYVLMYMLRALEVI